VVLMNEAGMFCYLRENTWLLNDEHSADSNICHSYLANTSDSVPGFVAGLGVEVVILDGRLKDVWVDCTNIGPSANEPNTFDIHVTKTTAFGSAAGASDKQILGVLPIHLRLKSDGTDQVAGVSAPIGSRVWMTSAPCTLGTPGWEARSFTITVPVSPSPSP
jgi:hypothetical protein